MIESNGPPRLENRTPPALQTFFRRAVQSRLTRGTGAGKTHLAIAVTAAVVRGRYFNTVDLVNRLKEERRLGKPGGLASQLARTDLVVLDELGCLPFARSSSTSSASSMVRSRDHHHQPRLRRLAERLLRRPQDDDRAPGPAHTPLRRRRDRQRQLAAKTPLLIVTDQLSTICATSPDPLQGD